MKVWVMDFGSGVEKAFTSIDKAYQVAWDWLISQGYNPEDEDEASFFNELKETYEDSQYSGFSVDEVLWCWEVEVE
jgi:hypothetical protein